MYVVVVPEREEVFGPFRHYEDADRFLTTECERGGMVVPVDPPTLKTDEFKKTPSNSSVYVSDRMKEV